jgi:hypothetical protein
MPRDYLLAWELLETGGVDLTAGRGEFLQKVFCHYTSQFQTLLLQWHLAVKAKADIEVCTTQRTWSRGGHNGGRRGGGGEHLMPLKRPSFSRLFCSI